MGYAMKYTKTKDRIQTDYFCPQLKLIPLYCVYDKSPYISLESLISKFHFLFFNWLTWLKCLWSQKEEQYFTTTKSEIYKMKNTE